MRDHQTHLWNRIGILPSLFLMLVTFVLLFMVGCSSQNGDSGEARADQLSEEIAGIPEEIAGVPGEITEAAGDTLVADNVELIDSLVPLQVMQEIPTHDSSPANELPEGRAPSPNPADYGDAWFANIVPNAKMGKAKARGMPPRKDDPEWECIITGRREVAVHDLEFYDGYESPVTLAQRILELMEVDSREGLRNLAINRYEFGDIFWPEFPTSRPVTNWKPDEAWFFHAGKVESGISEGLDYRGIELIFDSITCEDGHAPYTNFDLYHGVKIHAHKRESGEPVTLKFVKSFAYRKGHWKVFIYDD